MGWSSGFGTNYILSEYLIQIQKIENFLKIVDVLGREVDLNKVMITKTYLFYIFEDGSVDKKIIIE